MTMESTLQEGFEVFPLHILIVLAKTYHPMLLWRSRLSFFYRSNLWLGQFLILFVLTFYWIRVRILKAFDQGWEQVLVRYCFPRSFWQCHVNTKFQAFSEVLQEQRLSQLYRIFWQSPPSETIFAPNVNGWDQYGRDSSRDDVLSMLLRLTRRFPK